ncbi:unnamed protein product, partial [Rotaria magnacalcarata]
TTTTIEKNETTLICNTASTNDLDNKTRPTSISTANTTSVTTITTVQPKKEKPTA